MFFFCFIKYISDASLTTLHALSSLRFGQFIWSVFFFLTFVMLQWILNGEGWMKLLILRQWGEKDEKRWEPLFKGTFEPYSKAKHFAN